MIRKVSYLERCRNFCYLKTLFNLIKKISIVTRKKKYCCYLNYHCAIKINFSLNKFLFFINSLNTYKVCNLIQNSHTQVVKLL